MQVDKSRYPMIINVHSLFFRNLNYLPLSLCLDSLDHQVINMFKSGFIKLNKGEPPKEKTTKAPNDRGVVYLGHVPHGFYENEMKHYFTQFGEVTNINIPKSKKTGKAKGYAFVEFLYPEVAKVVAETMNNYLMHKKILVAKYLPPNQVKSNTFWRCNKNQIPLTIKNRSIQRKAMERPLNPEQEKRSKAALKRRIQSLQKKLKSKGIEYEVQIEV
ncbi:MKI67 FHA domain-interacting nucleolar phosphoprotein-like [Rhopalosiphum maidis]|uniref:MKI67 FHA domain-interacting nucleolar phosphoprotein-like n=1 Tax=Rhopalosiphum maidis TaxID=43146 RepID=UPI000EFFDB63|nr:MKI67 FHA domain-interacting nucleolar phosphoprotein-like [Rhopalosiphum maidis]